jgi:hypothetical protein
LKTKAIMPDWLAGVGVGEGAGLGKGVGLGEPVTSVFPPEHEASANSSAKQTSRYSRTIIVKHDLG